MYVFIGKKSPSIQISVYGNSGPEVRRHIINGMRLFATLLLLALLLLTSSQSFAQSTNKSTPLSAARQFYRLYLQLKMSGLPNEKDFQALAPLLTPELRRLIKAADKEQEEYAQKFPDNKPPWIEGDLFSSLYEGATSFKLGKAQVRGEYAEVTAHLVNNEGKPPARWTDLLVLKRTRDGWLVDDIKLKGEWAFKSGSSLRGILSAR